LSPNRLVLVRNVPTLSHGTEKMSRSPVLFRVDASPRVGWENLSRCLVLAAALQRRRRPAFFLSQLEPGSLGLTVKRGGNEWIDADAPAGAAEDLEEMVREVRRLRPAAVVIDSPDVKEDYLAELRRMGVLVVSIDSMAGVRFPSRLIINPLLAPDRDSYEFTRGTQVLLGARYAIVRPEIRRQRPIRSQEPVQPFRTLVALGDDDPHNQAGDLAKQLLNCPRIGRVDVAVRPWHPDLAGLQALAESCPDRLEIVSEPAEVPSRVSRCHFAVTAGNAWSLELACVGVPQLMVVQSETHWPTAQRLEEEGAATCLGWHANVSPATVRQAVQDLLSDPLERQSMARCGRKLIDGRGPDRLVTALEVLLHPSRYIQAEAAAA
jgi:spore coat polysaccharide biosynthesis predicted glycosyltransferase SpsG